MVRASIDIGSNTVLLLVGEVDGLAYKELENESRVTSLGKDLDKNQEFLRQSMEDSFVALREYVDITRKYSIKDKEVIVTATEASRVAKNSTDFFKRVKAELGLEIQIISTEGEAFYTSLGVVRGAGLREGEISIMDIGGASTEFIKIEVNPFRVVDSISLPFGSVRATDWLKAGTLDNKLNETIENSRLKDFKCDHLLCVAGSMTSLGGMILGLKKFDANAINGKRISFAEFLPFVDKLQGRTSQQILLNFPFLGKRAKSILGGALLGKKVGEFLMIKSFEISTLGLRYGTLFSGEIHEQYKQ